MSKDRVSVDKGGSVVQSSDEGTEPKLDRR